MPDSSPESSVEDQEGNKALTEHTKRFSYADVRHVIQVVALSHGITRRYRLEISSLDDSVGLHVQSAAYDSVIIATPLLDSGIESSSLDLNDGAVLAALLASLARAFPATNAAGAVQRDCTAQALANYSSIGISSVSLPSLKS